MAKVRWYSGLSHFIAVAEKTSRYRKGLKQTQKTISAKNPPSASSIHPASNETKICIAPLVETMG
jgi:hypothetical protein